jgi:hypothetical protein
MLSSRISLLCLLTVVGLVLVAASIPAAASAATQRHASPAGSGTACTSASPCAIKHAVEAAGTGDEVIVNPGDYPVTVADLRVDPGVTVHGVPGKPRPRLLFHNAPTPAMQVYDSTLRYVEVVRALGDQASRSPRTTLCSTRSLCAGARRKTGRQS